VEPEICGKQRERRDHLQYWRSLLRMSVCLLSKRYWLPGLFYWLNLSIPMQCCRML